MTNRILKIYLFLITIILSVNGFYALGLITLLSTFLYTPLNYRIYFSSLDNILKYFELLLVPLLISVAVACILPISRLGQDQFQLPFGLTAIFNIIHLYLAPIILGSFVRKKQANYIILLFFLYGLAETIALGSKGIVFEYLILGIMIAKAYNRKISSKLFPIIIIISSFISVFYIFKRFSLESINQLIIVAPLIGERLISGIITFNQILNHNLNSIDFESIKAIGFSEWTTRNIYGLEIKNHSSGTSFYGEFYLIFGKTGIIISLIIQFLLFRSALRIGNPVIRMLCVFDLVKILLFGGILGILLKFQWTNITHYIILLTITYTACRKQLSLLRAT